MAFDYNSRTKWEKARLERWNKEHKKQIVILLYFLAVADKKIENNSLWIKCLVIAMKTEMNI